MVKAAADAKQSGLSLTLWQTKKTDFLPTKLNVYMYLL